MIAPVSTEETWLADATAMRRPIPFLTPVDNSDFRNNRP
jgi:hypothetical protein